MGFFAGTDDKGFIFNAVVFKVWRACTPARQVSCEATGSEALSVRPSNPCFIVIMSVRCLTIHKYVNI